MEITPNSIGFTNESPYLYGAKELDRMHELQLYDFHARMLDNTIPGFTTPDPLAEQHPWESPYQFCGNNPVNRIDPTGLDWYAYSKGVAWFDNMHTHEGFSYNNENYKWIGEEVNLVNTEGDRFFGDMYGNLTQIIDIPEITVTPDGNYFNYLTGGGGGSGVAAQSNGDSLFGNPLGFVDKHFNGGLGYTGVAVNAFNKIPNNVKRHYAYELSKRTSWKSGKIFQNTKGFVNGTGKLVSRLGTIGSVLSGAAITYDLLDDGNLKSSSILNGALLGVGLTFPITAPFIIGYGILDYTFDIGDRIDRNFGTVNTGIYE